MAALSFSVSFTFPVSMALGIADRVWTIGDLLDAALATDPTAPEGAPDQRRFRVIDGGKS